MEKERFWEKSFDKGLTHLDPKLWEKTYLDLVKPTFESLPDKPAFTFLGREVTFLELDRYANRFAQMLSSQGLKKGDVVVINLPNIPQYIIAWLGAMKAGCIISGMSPLLSVLEMDYQLKDSDAKGLVTLDDIFTDKLESIVPGRPELKVIAIARMAEFFPGGGDEPIGGHAPMEINTLEGKVVIDFSKVINGGSFSDEPPPVDLCPDDIAYIQYTGGTTGAPKGAMLSHRTTVSSIIVFCTWMHWQPGGGLSLSCAPFFHIAGLFYVKFCMYLGWTQIVIPNPRDTDHICREIERYKPTIIGNVPTLYQMLMANPKFKTLDHSRLERCLSGAAPFPEDSQKELEKIIGKGKLQEVYGMTETSPMISGNPAKGIKKLGTIGLPLLNTDIKLVDHSTGRLVGVGEPGEICVKGPQVMIGYYKKEEETAAVIDQDGYLHTGDVAIQDEDGYLRIVDRTKDMIIVGGFKVFSKRVEEILTAHPAIEMIATVGLPNPDRPGSEIVKAFISLYSDYQSDLDEKALKEDIITFAKNKLAPYEVPKVIEFMEELPLTSVGKIDKKPLRGG